MITREDLYGLVWSVCGKVAAERLGVSDSYLGRACAALDVPRPPPGWWAKRAVGTAPPPPLLPAARPGFPDRWAKGGCGTPPIRQFYRDRALSVSEDDGAHPLVRLARSVFGAATASRDGTHLVTRRHVADVTSSAQALESALSLADALFKSLEARGHPVRIAPGSGFIRPEFDNRVRPPAPNGRIPPALWTPQAPTIAYISGVPVGLAVLEINEDVLLRYAGAGKFVRASSARSVEGITWTEWQRVPRGRLKLVAYSPHHPAPWRQEWSEARRSTLLGMTGAIVARLEAVAQTLPHASFYLRT